MPLNDLRCKNAKPKTKPYKLSDSGGLYLFVTPSGNKSWRFKYRYLGKEKTLTIGSYPAIALQEARKLRDQAKEQLRNGDDPSFEKAEQKRLVSYKAAQTFDLIAREWHSKYLDTWSEEHGKRILYRLNKTILQEIGHYPIDKLTPQLLLICLQKAESRSPDNAIKMLHYCTRIFQYAGLTGRLDRDLTFGLKGALKKPKRGHYACIPLEELPAFVKAIYAPVSKRRNIPNLAARFLMLTLVRTNELMKAEWTEFDFSRAFWRIPAARMKMRREHIVPLSRQSIEILMELKVINGHRRHVFASPVNPKQPMAKDVVLKELKRVGYGEVMTGHGFRTLAMGVIKEMLGYNHDPVDRQLAHLPKNSVDRAYDRSSFMRQRIPMMQAYADCLDAINSHEITYQEGNYDEQDYQQPGHAYHDYNPENPEHGRSIGGFGQYQPIHALPGYQNRAVSEAV
jgi:integrase